MTLSLKVEKYLQFIVNESWIIQLFKEYPKLLAAYAWLGCIFFFHHFFTLDRSCYFSYIYVHVKIVCYQTISVFDFIA
jgi:hypothetical protein